MEEFTKKRDKNIYLSDEDIEILEKYEINYANFKSMKELLFHIENMLLNQEVEDDLEELLIKLSEYNYYFNTNK